MVEGKALQMERCLERMMEKLLRSSMVKNSEEMMDQPMASRSAEK